MADRKKDHLDLTENAQFNKIANDPRFNYEPLLGSLNSSEQIYQQEHSFLGKTMMAPIWIGSMTGGTKEARKINQNLARMAGEFGLGMGLGSCRPILKDQKFFDDFNIRDILGDKAPLLANLGLAQVNELAINNELSRLNELVASLRADGLIIHINPAQEWFQPEGDTWSRPGIEIIKEVLEKTDIPIIVKEVGQGIGPMSLKALIELPLAAIEFGAYGGTNFSHLEMLRNENSLISCHQKLTTVGHSAKEMVHLINSIWDEISPEKRLCRQFIISGGIASYLDGYHLRESLKPASIYGQANAFLKYARGDYEELRLFAFEQLRGLEFARQFLRIKN